MNESPATPPDGTMTADAGVVRQVFGTPFTRDGRTLIPMAAVWVVRSGQRQLQTGRPVGVVVLDADGVHVHQTHDPTRLIALLLLVAAWNVFWIVRWLRRRG